MNGATMLKKTLPVLLTVLILVAIGLIVSGVLGKEKLNPSIDDRDVVYIQIEENGKTYKVTKGEMYDELKNNVGLSSLVTLVNKTILTNEKNAEGKSFFEAVTDDEVKAKIDEEVYGEDVDKDELDPDTKKENEEDFLNEMFKSFGFDEEDIYADSIKEYYQLAVAKEKYAEAQLKKAIAMQDAKAEQDEDEDPYFDDDEISDYYGENYNKAFWGIVVPFASSAEAKNALQQLGVVIDDSNDVWCWIKETTEDSDEIEEGSGVHKIEAGDKLTPAEVVETFIKLYNMVYGHTVEGGKVLVEGTDADYVTFDITENKEQLDFVAEQLEKAFKEFTAETDLTETLANLKDQIAKIDEKIKTTGYSLAKLSDSVKSLEEKLAAYKEETDSTKLDKLKDEANDIANTIISEIKKIEQKVVVFNKTNEESPLFFTYDELTDYNSSLRSKFSNTYTTYYPFATDSANISTNVNKPSWYSYTPVSLTANSKTFYTLNLKLGEKEAAKLDDVKAEIIAELTKAELTDSYVETKMAQLRENYEITIFDGILEADYVSSMTSYSVTHETTKEESDKNIVSIKLNTYEKVNVENKKEFKAEKKANGTLYVYNNGLYEAVKKYSEGEEYYKRNEGKEEVVSAKALFEQMDSNYGMTVALSELTYQRFLSNTDYNKYKDMVTGEWLDEDKRAEYIEEIETQRVNFLAGGYASYGYDPTTMSWEQFMKALYGASNEGELADSYLYSDILADYTAELNYIVKTNEDGELVNKDYQDLLNSKAWALYEQKMQEAVSEYFNVTGIHLLVSKYEDVADKVAGGTPLDPTTGDSWTDDEKELAKELINDVIAYVKASKGTYAAALQKVQSAFEAAPYYVDGNAPVIYDENGKVIEYTLSCAEVTIDVAKYKSAGLYVKYEDLGQFVNGTMVENFNDAVKKIWEKDMADKLTDRITVLEEAIETEFGYHLYINLSSSEIAKYDSNVVKVNEETKEWEYVYEEDGTTNVVEERVYPQLYEVLLYAENTSHEELSSGAQTAISSYYTTLAGEIAGSYFSYICQYTELSEMINDNSFANTSFNKAKVEKLIKLNIADWYENNFELLEEGNETEIVKGLKKGGK